MLNTKKLFIILATMTFSTYALARSSISAFATQVIEAELVDMIRYHQAGALVKLSKANTATTLEGLDYNIAPNKQCLAMMSTLAAVDQPEKSIILYFQHSGNAVSGNISSTTGAQATSNTTYRSVKILSCILKNK